MRWIFCVKPRSNRNHLCWFFAPFSPHGPTDPAPEDKWLYASLAPHRPPSFNEEDLSDKPAWLRVGRPASMDELRLKQIRTLKSLDRAIGDIVEELKATGGLDNTVIIYISDNGIQWGEHRLTKKATSMKKAYMGDGF